MVTLDPPLTVTPVEIFPPEGVVMEIFLPASRLCTCCTVRTVGSLLSEFAVEDFIPCSSGDVPCTTGITQLPIFTVWVPNIVFVPGLDFKRLTLDPRLGLDLLLGFRRVTPCLGFPEFNMGLFEAVGKGAW